MIHLADEDTVDVHTWAFVKPLAPFPTHSPEETGCSWLESVLCSLGENLPGGTWWRMVLLQLVAHFPKSSPGLSIGHKQPCSVSLSMTG